MLINLDFTASVWFLFPEAIEGLPPGETVTFTPTIFINIWKTAQITKNDILLPLLHKEYSKKYAVLKGFRLILKRLLDTTLFDSELSVLLW